MSDIQKSSKDNTLHYDIDYVQASIGPHRQLATKPFTWDQLKTIINENKLDELTRDVYSQALYLSHMRFLKRYWNSVSDYILVTKFSFSRILIACNNNDKPDEEEVALWKIKLPPVNSVYSIDLPPKGFKFGSKPSLDQYTTSILNQSNNGCTSKSTNNDSTISQLKLIRNDFPYYIEDNVQHWCLWKLGGGYVSQDEINHAMNVELPTKITLFQKEQESKHHIHQREEGNIGNIYQENHEEGEKLSNMKIKDVVYWVNPPHLKSIPDIDHAHILCLVEECM